MRFFLPILFSALMLACSRETEPVDIDFGYEYFPLQVGKAWEYQVDSIIFDPAAGGTAIDSTRTYAREEIVEFWADAAGDTIYRVERFERADSAQSWQIRKVVAMTRQTRQALRTEDNLTFVKLTFPVQKGASWDGTRLMDKSQRIIIAGEVLEMFKDWSSKVLEAGISYSHGALNFSDVAVVSHADSENNIEYRYAREVYARSVGLVFMEQRILDTQCVPCAQPWIQKAEKGFIVQQRLMRWE